MRTNLLNKISQDISEETFSNPISLSEIIDVCENYSKLGRTIQYQVSAIMEMGVSEAIKTGAVSLAALPHIKDFLQQVSDQYYFGDASDEAIDCIHLIEIFEDNNPRPLAIAN